MPAALNKSSIILVAVPVPLWIFLEHPQFRYSVAPSPIMDEAVNTLVVDAPIAEVSVSVGKDMQDWVEARGAANRVEHSRIFRFFRSHVPRRGGGRG